MMMENNIVEDMMMALDNQRDALSDLVNNETFDLDVQMESGITTKLVNQQKAGQKTASQIKREDRDVDTFKSTLHFYEKRRQDNKFSKTGREEADMDIVDNPDDIDKLDQGKSWKQLDNWMKKQKLKQFASTKPIENYEKTLLELYGKGEFRKTSDVTYDIMTGKILNLQSKQLNTSK